MSPLPPSLPPPTRPALPPLRSFTFFPLLPLELRLKIYSFILHTPRTVPVHHGRKPNPSIPLSYRPRNPIQSSPPPPPRAHLSTFTGWATTAPVPALLHVCQESRVEALKVYTLAFGNEFHAPKVWFSFDVDELFLVGAPAPEPSLSPLPPPELEPLPPPPYLLDLFLGGGYNGADDFEKVRYLRIHLTEEVFGRRTLFWDEVRAMEMLEEVVVVAWEKGRADGRDVEEGIDGTRWVADYLRRAAGYVRRALGVVKSAEGSEEWRVPMVTVGWGEKGEEGVKRVDVGEGEEKGRGRWSESIA